MPCESSWASADDQNHPSVLTCSVLWQLNRHSMSVFLALWLPKKCCRWFQAIILNANKSTHFISCVYTGISMVRWVLRNDLMFGHVGQISALWQPKNYCKWWFPIWRLYLHRFVQNLQDLWKSGHGRTLLIEGAIGCKVHHWQPFCCHVCSWPVAAKGWRRYQIPRSNCFFFWIIATS